MRFDAQIVNVKAPIIAVHGKQDPVIPVSSARDLIAKITSNSQFIEVDGDHDTLFWAEVDGGLLFRACKYYLILNERA